MPDPTLSTIVNRFLDSNDRAAAVVDFPAHGIALLRFVRDHVHPGDVFGDRVAFVPGVADAACDVIPDDPGDRDGIAETFQNDPCAVEPTNGAGLIAELADALSEGGRIALLVNGEHLATLIEALQVVPHCHKALRASVRDLLPGLRQLYDETFGD